MNKDLSIITDQTFQWEIFFNRDLSKQAQETSTIQREASTGSFKLTESFNNSPCTFDFQLILRPKLTSQKDGNEFGLTYCQK